VKSESRTAPRYTLASFACTSSVRESLSSENVYGSLRSGARHCGSLAFPKRLSARNSAQLCLVAAETILFSMRTNMR
jgi:hypothetical protein